MIDTSTGIGLDRCLKNRLRHCHAVRKRWTIGITRRDYQVRKSGDVLVSGSVPPPSKSLLK